MSDIHSRPRCRGCGHVHTGQLLGGICIGCGCPHRGGLVPDDTGVLVDAWTAAHDHADGQR